jgi:hypothetical protein
MNEKTVSKEAEGQAKAEVKGISLQDILARLEKLEKTVFNSNDKPIGIPAKRNFNSDTGPFPNGSGVSTIK